MMSTWETVSQWLLYLSLLLLLCATVAMKRAEREFDTAKAELEALNGKPCKCGHSYGEHRDYKGIGNTACFYITCLCESYRELTTQ